MGTLGLHPWGLDVALQSVESWLLKFLGLIYLSAQESFRELELTYLWEYSLYLGRE